jgi:hypothetical protein
MALFCGQSAIADGRVYRPIQQKMDNAVCERFLKFTMPEHWLGDTRSWIAIPIVSTSISEQNASTFSNNLIRSARYMV